MSQRVIAGSSSAEELVTELVPEDFDWQRLVVTYPKTSILIAALGGYLLGRSRGAEIVGGISAFAADSVSRNLNELLGEDVL